MNWRLYSLRFRVLSPIHVGSLPVGNILKTRPYVTGKAFWGAVTEALVRSGYAPANSDGYLQTGQDVQRYLRFGYFFPATEDQACPRLPGYDSDGRDWFEYEFLDTYSSTAINSEVGSAEPNSLHEIEVIRTFTRPVGKAEGKRVHLIGHLMVAGDCPPQFFDSLLALLSRVQIGGRRAYGFGQIRLAQIGGATEIHGATFEEDGTVMLPKNQPASAHIQMTTDLDSIKHPIQEPFLGREWKEQEGFGAGQFISTARPCYCPGTVFESSEKFQVGEFGIWKPLSL